MPQRPRSHQLEAASRLALEAKLPVGWVIRSKTPDYGVDFEVEIFDHLGSATGMIFNIQLRATDDIKKRTKINIKVNQVEYFHSLDVPTALIRYYSQDQSFHWCWAGHVAITHISPQQKSVTVKFAVSQAWRDETPEAIRATLSIWRALRSCPPYKPIPLRLLTVGLSVSDLYCLESAVGDILNATPLLEATQNFSDEVLLIDISLTAKTLRVAFGEISSVSISQVQSDIPSLYTSLIYLIALLTARFRLLSHANALLQLAISMRLAHPSPTISAIACTVSGLEIESAVSLAVINGIHCEQGPRFISFLSRLHSIPSPALSRMRALSAFYLAAIDAQPRSESPEVEAALRYNLATAYAIGKSLKMALRQYNMTRRLRPAYMKTPYFLLELAGSLFELRRYSISAVIYEMAVTAESPPEHHFRLGDALFFSGRLADATTHFAKAQACSEPHLSYEALLKLGLCDWISARLGSSFVPTRRFASSALVHQAEKEGTASEALWATVTSTVQVLDPLSNFNRGVIEAARANYSEAIGYFLVAAFGQTNDLEAWANAVSCSINAGLSAEGVAIMGCASFFCGRQAYDRFRVTALSQGLPEEAIQQYDLIQRELTLLSNGKGRRDFTARIFEGDAFKEIVIAFDR